MYTTGLYKLNQEHKGLLLCLETTLAVSSQEQETRGIFIAPLPKGPDCSRVTHNDAIRPREISRLDHDKGKLSHLLLAITQKEEVYNYHRLGANRVS